MNSRDILVNYQEIVFSGNENIIRVEADSIAWGKQVLRSLNLRNMNDFEKAQENR